MGASTVKYTTSLPYIGLSEINSKLYNKFKFCEGINHKHLKKHIDLQSQTIHVDKKHFEKCLHILEDSASNVQVDILTCNGLKFA